MPITINGSGTVTGISAGGLPDDSIVTADIAAGAVTQAKRSEDLTLGTAQNSTSGTSIDFTSIPSWVKRVTVMFSGVSTNGTSQLRLQLGAGSFAASGYLGSCTGITSNVGFGSLQFSSGFDFADSALAAAVRHGAVRLTNVASNTWVIDGTTGQSNETRTVFIGGSVTLSGTLDRLRITTVNGTDTFDAGSINILYE